VASLQDCRLGKRVGGARIRFNGQPGVDAQSMGILCAIGGKKDSDADPMMLK